MNQESFDKLKTTKLDCDNLILEFKGEDGGVTFCSIYDIFQLGVPFECDDDEKEMELIAVYSYSEK